MFWVNPNIKSTFSSSFSKESKWAQGEIQIPQTILNKAVKERVWIQILNEQGQEIFQFHRPKGQKKQYTIAEFFYKNANNQQIIYQSGNLNGQKITYLVGQAGQAVASKKPVSNGQFNLIYLIIFVISSILSVLIVAVLFGKQLSGPIIHMLNWIEQLSKGRWEEPLDRRGLPKSFSPKTGKLRRPYQMYEEILGAFQHLTDQLKRTELDRKRLDQTREEWVAGISHDLKTPLSSVKGYADLLAESSYHWSREEVKQYAQVIQDKAIHMDSLLEDLNVTYRLKNEALPLQKKEENLVELVRQTVIDLVNDPRSENQEITFQPLQAIISYEVDKKWFQRALSNLLVNAVIHNPDGTQIQVLVGQNGQETFIKIQDDGQVMDEETITHLFDRYYRGTNTRSKGVGTGLGMAIAQQLIHAHGGQIDIDSQVGRGTKLVIQFMNSK